MSDLVQPIENPLFKMLQKMWKKKILELAQEHNCYKEVKTYYEIKELLKKTIAS